MQRPKIKSKILAKFLVYLSSFQMMLLPLQVYGQDFSNFKNFDFNNIDRNQISDVINNASPEEIEAARKRAEEEAAKNGINSDNAADKAQEFADQNGIDTSELPSNQEIEQTISDNKDVDFNEQIQNNQEQIKQAEAAAAKELAERSAAEEAARLAEQARQEEAAREAKAAAEKALQDQLAAEEAARLAEERARIAAEEAAAIADARARAIAEAKAAADRERARLALEAAERAKAESEKAAADLAAKQAAEAAAAQASQDAKIAARLAAKAAREKEQAALTLPPFKAQLDPVITDSPEPTPCPEGQTRNALTGLCLTSGENLLVKVQEGRCDQLSGEEKDQCLGNIQDLANKTVNAVENDRQPAASDASSDGSGGNDRRQSTENSSSCSSSAEARQCEQAGHTFNCDLNFCATKQEQTELTAGFLTCKLKGTAEAEKACIGELEDKVAGRVASGGVLCDNDNSPAATQCRQKGRTWNCNHKQCLSDEMVSYLKDETKSCTEIEDSTAKESCMNGLESKAIGFVASGKNCDNSGNAEAKQCTEQGKIFNCNIDYCLTQEQNEKLTAEVVTCKTKDNTADENICMSQLEDKAIDHMLFQCDLSDNPKGQSCNAEGKQWNCQLNVCLSKDDNQRLINAFKNCKNKPTKAEQDACFGEIQQLADAASEGDGNISAKLDEGKKTLKRADKAEKAIAAIMASVGAVTAIAGFAGSKGVCMSSMLNVAAAGMAMITESNTKKESQQKLDALKKEYEALEKRKAEQGISFELQVEAFRFYLKAANTAESIARNKQKGYQSTAMTFGMAAAIAAIETIIYLYTDSSKLSCAYLNLAAAGVGAALSAMLAKIAGDAAKEYKELGERVQRLLALFEKHFKDKGSTGASRFARDYTDVKTDNGDRNTIERSKIAAKESGEKQDIASLELSQEQNSCATNTGELDANCSCKKTNSCSSISVNSLADLGANGAKFSKQFNLADNFNDVNRISRGEINASNLDARKLQKNAARFRKVANKILRTSVNKKLKEKGRDPIVIDKKTIDKFVKKLATPKQIAKIKSQFYSGPGIESLVPKGTELEKSLAKENIRIPSSTQLSSSRRVTTSPSSIDFGDDEELLDANLSESDFDLDKEDKDDALANNNLLEEPTYDYSKVKGAVIKNPNISLFKAISNRYNVLRLEKRFGRRVVR